MLYTDASELGIVWGGLGGHVHGLGLRWLWLYFNQGIVDGFKGVIIPVEADLKNNTAAGRVARAQRMIPAAEIEFYWYTTIEKIIITRVSNEAT